MFQSLPSQKCFLIKQLLQTFDLTCITMSVIVSSAVRVPHNPCCFHIRLNHLKCKSLRSCDLIRAKARLLIDKRISKLCQVSVFGQIYLLGTIFITQSFFYYARTWFNCLWCIYSLYMHGNLFVYSMFKRCDIICCISCQLLPQLAQNKTF